MLYIATFVKKIRELVFKSVIASIAASKINLFRE